MEFAPPLSLPEAIQPTLTAQGYAVAGAQWVQSLCQAGPGELATLARAWDDMPLDPYLKDGGRYRSRRHGSFIVDGEHCEAVAPRAHFQSTHYNALHGGMERWFAPIEPQTAAWPGWSRLLVGLGALFSQVRPSRPWFVEAHQFRIDASEGIGRPTPEGAHRDGVDFVALILIARNQVRGGETRVFAAHRPDGLRFTLSEPFSIMLLDDERVIHESTPIQPIDPIHAESGPEAASSGYRDTLVLTFRRGGFQDP